MELYLTVDRKTGTKMKQVEEQQGQWVPKLSAGVGDML